MKAIGKLLLCLASLETSRAKGIPERLRHKGRADTIFSHEPWKTCPAKKEDRAPKKSLPGRALANLKVEDKRQVDASVAALVAAAANINAIVRRNLGKSSKNEPVLITAFVGCPDGSSGGMVEILQLTDEGEPTTASFPHFLKIDGIAGESDDGGGGGGSSGGCYDEDLGVCCEGPCPC